jgi:hypothetical protein
MDHKRRNGFRAIAALLLLSVVQISLQIGFAEPNDTSTAITLAPQLVGRLTTKNNQPVMVNGLSATSGASILSGATIETGADQSATVDLGPLGSLDIAENTKVVLTFDEQRNVKAVVALGCVTLNAKKGTTGEIATEQSSIGKTDPAAGGVLNNCSTQPAPPAPPPSDGGGGLFGLGRAATIAIFAGAGAAATTPLFFQDNPSPSGSNP